MDIVPFTIFTFSSTIVAFGNGGESIHLEEGTEMDFYCCDIYGNEGGDWVELILDSYLLNGNISYDPLFCHPESGNFTLQDCSPCLPNAFPESGCYGFIGACPETGCSCYVPVAPTSWGRIKLMYQD